MLQFSLGTLKREKDYRTMTNAIYDYYFFSSLVMKMNSRLLTYWELQSQGPTTFNKVEIERWYTHTTERIRKAQRKLLRFYK